MLPLRDINPVSKPPVATRALIIANVLAFIPIFMALYVLGDPELYAHLLYTLGVVPERLLALQALYTLITSMFTHADIIHIFGNMLYLHIFGDNVEDVMGKLRFLAFYFYCGLAASLAHILACLATNTGLDIPAVGASGAISGILGAYLVFFPRARILTLNLIGRGFIMEVRAIHYILFWFIYQVLWALFILATGVLVSVAFWAHIGGFLAGLVAGFILKEGIRAEASARGWIGW